MATPRSKQHGRTKMHRDLGISNFKNIYENDLFSNLLNGVVFFITHGYLKYSNPWVKGKNYYLNGL